MDVLSAEPEPSDPPPFLFLLRSKVLKKSGKKRGIVMRELNYFEIDNAYGGCQDWFLEGDYSMKAAGCAALAACDSCIYLDLHKNMDKLYPYPTNHLNKESYMEFSKIMKPYLRPRWKGIDRLERFIEGMENYLHDIGEDHLTMEPFHGTHTDKEAEEKVREQIDQGMPIPFLLLKHADRSLRDYVWHWFLLTAYKEENGRFYVKAVTFGTWKWLDFETLWNTGREEKGGLILYHCND